MTKEIKYPSLVAEMARRGINQGELAKIIISSQGSISRKIAGKNQWTIEEIDKICKYFDKDYYELFK